MQAAGAEHKKKLDDIAKARQEDLAKPALSRPGLESPRTQVISQLDMLDRLHAISAGRAPTDNAAREALDLQRKMAADLAIIAKNSGGIP
jgi:hypothetical protein